MDMLSIRSAIVASAARATLAGLATYAVLATSAQGSTSATIAPSLSPNRLGARAALTFTIRYAGGEFGVPSAVRRSVLRFPAGLSLEVPNLRSCAASRLRARGASGCPAQSGIGSGQALVEAHAGSQTITENVALWAFLGPPRNLQPTFAILGQGYTPLEKRVVFTGVVLGDRAPYGEELVMSIPPIPTLPFESDASIVTFSLTIGAGKRSHLAPSATAHGHRRAGVNAVVVPSVCPVGGFPFAAEFTYADGSSGSAAAKIPCPR